MGEFFSGMGAWLSSLNLNWWQSLIFLVLISFIILVVYSDKIKSLLKIKGKRSCIDCLSIIFGEEKIYYAKQNKISKDQEKVEDKILKNQMDYAEQKLAEIESSFIDFYNSLIHKKRTTDTNIIPLLIQNKLFYSLIRDSIYLRIRDDIRKRFKSNGYYEISGFEFTNYVKNFSQSIYSLFKQTMIQLYPPNGHMFISIDDVLKFMEDYAPEFEDIIFESVIYAKKIKNEAIEKIKQLENELVNNEKEFESKIRKLIEEVKK